MKTGGAGLSTPLSLKCRYPGGEYSAELSCAKCIRRGKPCGSQAIQVAHEDYMAREKERGKPKRKARQAERRKMRRNMLKKMQKMRDAKEALRLRRQVLEDEKAELLLLRAAARKRLKHDRRLAALNRELTLWRFAHLELVSFIKSEESWERQQLELLETMNELIGQYEQTFT